MCELELGSKLTLATSDDWLNEVNILCAWQKNEIALVHNSFMEN